MAVRKSARGPQGSEKSRLARNPAEGFPRLSREGRPNFVFAFHERVEIGPKMLARIAKHTGLKPEDL